MGWGGGLSLRHDLVHDGDHVHVGEPHLGLPVQKRSGRDNTGPFAFLPTYLRRIVKYRQMDFEYSFWLMLQLLVSPKTAYRRRPTTSRRKTGGLGTTRVRRDMQPLHGSLGQRVLHLLRGVRGDLDLQHPGGRGGGLHPTGRRNLHPVLVAGEQLPSGWEGQSAHTVEQRVEWLYAFDVHCNSYFPVFLMLYVVQYLLSPLLLARTFISSLLAIALYGFALSLLPLHELLGLQCLPSAGDGHVPVSDRRDRPAGAAGLLVEFNPAIHAQHLLWVKCLMLFVRRWVVVKSLARLKHPSDNFVFIGDR